MKLVNLKFKDGSVVNNAKLIAQALFCAIIKVEEKTYLISKESLEDESLKQLK